MPHIGTLREKPLHASLKRWYAEPDDLVEVAVDGYVIDLLRDDLLIEIQTGGWAPMRRKLEDLLGRGHRIRIVAPVAVDKWIVKIEDDGTILDRRLSPKHQSALDVFARLVSFPKLVVSSDLTIEVVLTSQEELRIHREGKAWRRKGWVVSERRLLEVSDSMTIAEGSDLLSVLPASLPGTFTTSDLSRLFGCSRRLAQQTAYCLRECGLLSMAGKKGNAIVYQLVS